MTDEVSMISLLYYNCQNTSSFIGQSRADEIIVNSFMIVFTYLFGGYKEYMATMDHRTGEKQLQVK